MLDSYNYVNIMKELDEQSNKKVVTVQVAGQSYDIKNPGRVSKVYELEATLSEQMYDSVRECDTDVSDIAKNLGFKASNVKKVKDHVFYNKHFLDRYKSEATLHKRFDASLPQVLAWKRMEIGIHNQDDINWMKHELSERHHELKYDSGYSEAHDRAQSRFDGAPWDQDW